MRVGWPKTPDDIIPFLEWISDSGGRLGHYEIMWKDGLIRYLRGRGHVEWKGEGVSPIAGLEPAKDEDGTFRTRTFLRYFTGAESLPPPGQQIVVCAILSVFHHIN